MTYPKTMYRAQGYSISPVKVVRGTEKFVTIEHPALFGGKPYERREARRSDFANIFNTWEDAKSFIVTKQEQKVIGLRAELEGANGRLGQLRGMKKPEES